MLKISYNPFAGLNFRYVADLSHLPAPVGDVWYLPSGSNWKFTKDLDFMGKRFVCLGPVSIQAASSETVKLKSTGLSGALFTTQYSLVLESISIECPTGSVFDIDGDNTAALDWRAVNIYNTPDIGIIKDVSNFIMAFSTFADSQNLVMSGNGGTIAFFTVLFRPAAGVCIQFASDAVVSRRSRFTECAFVAPLGVVAIDIAVGASIPIDQLICTSCSFTGGSTTFITGTTATSDIADFFRNKGIANSATLGQIYGEDLAVPTPIAAINTFYALVMASTAGLMQRFTSEPNKLIYTGQIQKTFRIAGSLSFTSGNNNVVKIIIRHYNSAGTIIKTSVARKATTSGSGKSENVDIEEFFQMSNGDYIKLFGANTSAINDITVTDFTVSSSVSI